MINNMNKIIGHDGRGTRRLDTIDGLGRDLSGSKFPNEPIPQEEYDNLDNVQDLDRGFQQEGLSQPNQNEVLSMLRQRMSQPQVAEVSPELDPTQRLEQPPVDFAQSEEQMDDSEFDSLRPRLMELAKLRMTKEQV
jgi:hypothetical protein